MGDQSSAPLQKVYRASFVWNWCWAVIAGSVGLNALIKFNRDKRRFSHEVPPPTVVTIDISDIFTPGLVATILSTIIAVILSNLFTLFLIPKSRAILSTPKILRIQAGTLLFLAFGLFATMIPLEYFFATRSAKVTAFVGTVQLPQTLVNSAEQLLGISPVYKKTSYLKLVAIFPWFNFFFTVVTASILLVAASKESKEDTEAGQSGSAIVEKGSRT